MKRAIVLGIGVAAVIATAFVAVSVAAGPNITGPLQVHVIEHANTDAVIDTGGAGDTSGDLLTFHNPVFDSGDAARVGSDQGQCVRIVPGASWECTWTTFLPGGHITVEGPFFDTRNSVIAVTGGTGAYRNARGAMLLRSRAGGTKFDFVFRLIR